MYIKRLAEIFVQKALLLSEILSFEVYCRSDSHSPTRRYGESATPRLTDTGSRRLFKFRSKSNCFAFVPIISFDVCAFVSISLSTASYLIYNKLQNFIYQKLIKLYERIFQQVFLYTGTASSPNFSSLALS